ncbi:MAG: aldehyde dehydrogenase [Salinarimonas sp.]|nr:aldehyde dehydrogenase [Salinarimonas sp.]
MTGAEAAIGLRDALAAAPRNVTGFVAGGFVRPHGEALPIADPATGQTVAILHESDAHEVDAAVRAARHAFDHGPWPKTGIAARQQVLMAIHDAIMAHADELAALESINTGVPLAQTRGMHIPRAAYNFKFFAEYINHSAGELYQQEEGFLTLVSREPMGVCALIGPWNVPLGLTSMKLAAALAFGNTCVVKPSEMTPLTVARLFQLMGDCGLPEGVVNLVNGRGHVTGAALSGHPGIDMVSFTGGTETGRAIMGALAKGIKGSAMELGGKSANIVFDDADFDRALDGALLGVFANNGQMCLAGSRIFVQRPIAERFMEAFVARMQSIRIGDPLGVGTELGPMINAAQKQRMIDYVGIGEGEGATLLGGGKTVPGMATGYFVQPTAMLSHDNRARLCQEEIFGPFATFQVFDEEDEVVWLANESRFGLAGYVWTEGLGRAHRVAQVLRTGTIWVNTPMVRDLRSAFGGYKESGIGREGGRGCEAMYTEIKTTMIPVTPRPIHKLGGSNA